MSELLSKSKENLVSADLLIKRHKKFSSSIHCSYYACLQMILHIIECERSKYDKFASDYIAQANPDDDTTKHFLYIKYIQMELIRDRSTFSFGQSFTANIFPLKTSRNKSDYTIKVIDDTLADKSYERAIAITKDLKTVYGL